MKNTPLLIAFSHQLYGVLTANRRNFWTFIASLSVSMTLVYHLSCIFDRIIDPPDF